MSKIRIPKSAEEAYRRAGGRRRYHARRRREAEERRARVAELVMQWGWVQGTQARIARELGVSEATISRDMRKIYTGPEGNKLLLQRTIVKALKKATRKIGHTAT
jgi:DNA invertase Pin-like site-specific DNA recombinase